jgi:hypothetical protein
MLTNGYAAWSAQCPAATAGAAGSTQRRPLQGAMQLSSTERMVQPPMPGSIGAEGLGVGTIPAMLPAVVARSLPRAASGPLGPAASAMLRGEPLISLAKSITAAAGPISAAAPAPPQGQAPAQPGQMDSHCSRLPSGRYWRVVTMAKNPGVYSDCEPCQVDCLTGKLRLGPEGPSHELNSRRSD